MVSNLFFLLRDSENDLYNNRNAWIFIALPEQSKLLKEYNEDFFKTWHLKNAESTVSRQRSTLLAIAICYHVSCFSLGLPISSLYVKENKPY